MSAAKRTTLWQLTVLIQSFIGLCTVFLQTVNQPFTMSSIRGKTVIVLVLFLLQGVFSVPPRLPTGEPSPTLLTFLSLFSGRYTNVKEVQDEKVFKDEFIEDVSEVEARPVSVASLSPAPVVYYSETMNGKAYRRMVIIFSVDEEGIVHGSQYNLTNPSRFNTFDEGALKDLKAEDYEVSPKECDLTFMQIDDDVFMGTWPDCFETDSAEFQHHPVYSFTITCHGISVLTFSTHSREKPSPAPYNIIKKTSYPLLPETLKGVPDFQQPCQ